MEVFKYRPKKLPKVIRKKLGKEQAWGRYIEEDNIIEIDERLKGKRELILYLHEYVHAVFPELSEDEVIIKSESMALFLWRNNFRRVDLGTKEKEI